MIRLALAGLLLGLTLVGAPAQGLAAAPSLNWGSEVNPSRCPTDQGYRYLEINVTRKVEGEPAMDPSGNVWAILEFNQHIQVWKVGTTGGGERFCALVRYQGSFTTVGGVSPGGTDPSIAPGIDGSFEGGYRLVFEAEEVSNPSYGIRGHIGTFSGPLVGGLTDWLGFYYNASTVPAPEWWGWVYHGGNNGAWVNAITGNQGDIID